MTEKASLLMNTRVNVEILHLMILFLFYFLKITLSRSGRWYPIYAMLQACQQQIKLYLDARWNW